MTSTLYHFWSCSNSQRIRMALSYKAVEYNDVPLSYWDDESFFELGLARQVPILKLNNENLLTDSLDILWNIDQLFPVESKSLVIGKVDAVSWQALLDWRQKVDALLSRLHAPALLIYKDISEDESSIQHYKQQVQQCFNMSAEALANDRYAAYAQFATLTNIKALGLHLTRNRFYLGELSIADILITADIYTLQCLDGVSMPIDILYYLHRVETACNIDLQQGMVRRLS